MSVKYLAFIFVLLSATYTHAQTKPKTSSIKPKPNLEETMNWIVEKLNANSIDDHDIATTSTDAKAFYTDTRYNFIFDSQSQSLNYTYKYQVTTNFDNTNTNDFYNISIPLNKIYKVEFTEDEPKKLFLTIHTYGKDVSEVNTKNNSSKSYTSTSIRIDFTREPNLRQRFQKAFENVKSYFPKKQETF